MPVTYLLFEKLFNLYSSFKNPKSFKESLLRRGLKGSDESSVASDEVAAAVVVVVAVSAGKSIQ